MSKGDISDGIKLEKESSDTTKHKRKFKEEERINHAKRK